jgi:hypothetical protein
MLSCEVLECDMPGIRHFRVDELDCPFDEIIRTVDCSFDFLEDDPYDQRMVQLALLKNHPTSADYSWSEVERVFFETGTHPILDRLSPKERLSVGKIRPWRKRAIAYYIARGSNGEVTELKLREENLSFQQTVSDYRNLPRKFPLIHPDIANAPIVRKLIENVICEIPAVHSNDLNLSIKLHQVRTLTFEDSAMEVVPEGLHQDGEDCVVSALIIQKYKVDGAQSVVFDRSKRKKLFEKTLDHGEGLLHCDRHYWHDVSPLTTTDETSGFRDILGLDIRVIG